MEWVITVLGVGLVVVVVRDVFHTLFHPIGHGSIAPQVMKLVWRLLRLFPSDRRIASLTVPLGITAVIITWGVTAVLGWMLIYFPQMPNAVSYSSELNPAERNELIDSLYLSWSPSPRLASATSCPPRHGSAWPPRWKRSSGSCS